jgi:hypothetical protein
MLCLNCGQQNVETSAACQHCGSLLQRAGARPCPSGQHLMDPNWTECRYCAALGSAASGSSNRRRETVIEGISEPRRVGSRAETEIEGLPGRTPVPPRPAGLTPPVPVRTTSETAKNPRPNTVYSPVAGLTTDSGKLTPVPTASNDRKIVGVLVTYSWSSEGQIFPIREGRNLIGRDKDCEICVLADQTLSGRNSHITYRQNFTVGDMVSMTGTDLNGVCIEEQFHNLTNYATIRAGSTYFTFIAIQPPSPA